MVRPISVAVFALCLWSGALVVAAGRHAEPRGHGSAQTAQTGYPPGAGRDVVIRVCTDCHAVTDITRRRESRRRWGVIVDEMANHGASFNDADFEAMVAYLSVTFGRPIKVNTAPAAVLAAALDISDDAADAIVKYRATNGPFKDWKAVTAVPGLDRARVEEQRNNFDFTIGS